MPVLYLVLVALAWVVARIVYNCFRPGLRQIPGPFWARFSNIWRLVSVQGGKSQFTLIDLHRKHGDYVRIGPNCVSIRNGEALKTIYAINSGFVKTNFYHVQRQMNNGVLVKPTLFTSLDENYHASIKRPVANAYSMTTLAEFEPFVNSTISLLFKRLDELYVYEQKPCPIFDWLQYYAFDVIGELTFSRTLGFLESGTDVMNIISNINKTMDYAAPIGQMPWLDYLFVKNPIFNLLASPTGAVAKFAEERLNERLRSPNGTQGPSRDFLTRFFEAAEKYPDIVDVGQIHSYLITNIFAGSDTTAISLRAIVYYTLKNPRVLERLMEELTDALKSGSISYPITWRESQKLPYLDAMVKEALRIHTAIALPLERVVPEPGLQLPNGPFLKSGTIVGASPWVVHRGESIFGADADSFKPERWLQSATESKGNFEARKSRMNRAFFAFGAGPRTCIGRNISLLEMYKLIPAFFLRYQPDLVDPKATWNVSNKWFASQTGIEILLRKREEI